MVGPSTPFRTERYEIGPALALEPMRSEDAGVLADAIPTFGPWTREHYAVDPDEFARSLLAADDGASRYVITLNDRPAGVVIVRNPWLAGPYLQLLAVLPQHQRAGIGSHVLGWMEAEAAGRYPNLWLCVSHFNADAERFYRRHGFELAARLGGLLRPGIDELLMRKRLRARQ